MHVNAQTMEGTIVRDLDRARLPDLTARAPMRIPWRRKPRGYSGLLEIPALFLQLFIDPDAAGQNSRLAGYDSKWWLEQIYSPKPFWSKEDL